MSPDQPSGAVPSGPAAVHTIGGKPVLRLERRLAHPPEKVWRAVTDPAELAHWFPASVEVDLRVGATMRFTFEEDAEVTEGEVLEVDPPKVFSFGWGGEVFRIELLPDEVGCRLVFTQTLGNDGAWGAWPAAGRNAAGWDMCLNALWAHLDGRSMESAGGMALIAHYVERLGLAEGTVVQDRDDYIVRFERDLIWKPVDDVWASLNVVDDPPADGPAPLEVGSPPPVRFTTGYVSEEAITALDPPRMLEYWWSHDGDPAGRVRFEIESDPDLGVRLIVTHTVPRRLADQLTTILAAWHTHLELFVAHLHDAPPEGCWPSERTASLERLYADRLAGHGPQPTGQGELGVSEDGRFELWFERKLAHPPEKVWRAITEEEHLRAWFPAVVAFEFSPGAKLRFAPTEVQLERYGMSADDVSYGEITRVEPPHLLEYTWGAETLRWEVQSDGQGGTRLVFVNLLDDRDTGIAAASGWHAGLEVVEAQLDGRPIDWSPHDRADELYPEYVAALDSRGGEAAGYVTES